MIMTNAQLVCYDWKPVKDTTTAREFKDDKIAVTHFGYEAKAANVEAMLLENCTLVYRKALDHDIAAPGKVATRLTPDGLLVPEKTGKMTYSRTLVQQTENTENCYNFDGTKSLTVPILKYTPTTTTGGMPVYCIDYRDGMKIIGLYQGKGSGTNYVTTKKLHGANSVYGTPAPMKIHFDDKGDNKGSSYAPLRNYHAPTKIQQTVKGHAALEAKDMAAALARHSVTNVIGVAMQRIAPNHQGDLMLSDSV